jgi:isopentenyl-diphosphate delta-isomerase
MIQTREFVVLVDKKDNEIGTMEKIEAHQKGILHRAISVFIFNELGHLLLQRRALGKYHSPGLWTNTCCSHPHPGEPASDAAHRRLFEEMGLKSELNPAFKFTYKADFNNGLTEYELDHVFFGNSNESPIINKTEVVEWRYESLANIRREIQSAPHYFTYWFKECFDQIVEAAYGLGMTET